MAKTEKPSVFPKVCLQVEVYWDDTGWRVERTFALQPLWDDWNEDCMRAAKNLARSYWTQGMSVRILHRIHDRYTVTYQFFGNDEGDHPSTTWRRGDALAPVYHVAGT